MTPIPFFQVDAAADRPFAGNPAAVMPLDHWLADEVMQAIAQENNLSETAFTVPCDTDEADYHLRWFTPTDEVDMCGHATLAAGHVLSHGKPLRFLTRSGVLTVSRDEQDEGLLQLDLPAGVLREDEVPGLAAALGLSERTAWLADGCNDSAIMLLDNEAQVRAVRPDFAALKALPHMAIVTAPGAEHAIASRVFCPYLGIDEDPVTGSAHAALVPFWAERLGRTRFTALQASKRSGTFDCELRGDRVVLGARCVTVIEGYFQL
ncbi:PhzF family phenazine biosynthesis protein [Sphingomonas jaspsi]|uniref:PhzF family phenazine biosynthesis protein n=1 Tax=Sphingomonas jaspsi TaxID=392409 RepID=UPI0004B1F5FA|nr:PhzF family phenazine biosynthesis protein [Sphingomonas jaspsi]